MKPISYLITFLGIVCILSGNFVIANEANWTYEQDFENEWNDWTTDSDVPMDPNNPGDEVAWNISRNDQQALSGNYSLKYQIDGRQDDGVIWIERSFSLDPNRNYHISLNYSLYSFSESFNKLIIVVGYINTTSPETEEDFDYSDGRLGYGNDVAGWKGYHKSTQLKTDSSRNIWIGLGISVIWETELVYWIDDIIIEFFPGVEEINISTFPFNLFFLLIIVSFCSVSIILKKRNLVKLEMRS